MMLLGCAFCLFLLLNTTQAKTGYFWHISDIHLDTEYSTSGDSNYQCRRTDGASNRRPGGKFGKFGDYNCDSPWALVESAALAMKRKQGENIEFVLWTGDGITAGSSREHQMKVLQNLTDLLKHTFSSQFVFPVLGHDDPTPGLHYGLGYEDVGDLWKHWLPSEAIQTFNKGGYYTIEQKERKLRIVALNTNLCSDMVGNADDPAGQWQWLEEIFNKSQRSGETVYLVGHMPPGVDERLSGSFIYQQQDVFQGRFNQRYIRLVRKYAHVIVGQFFGHLHSDSFRIIYDENGVPVSWIFISPAVSPKGTISGPNNPGLRLYKFDANSGQVLDYQQYYLDLSAANQRGVANWQAEYNLSDYYGLKEISAQELNKLADNFGSSDGTNLFSRYYRANSVKVHQSTSGCDSSCAHTHYCAITRLDYTEFRSCLESAASALASSATSMQYSIHYSLLVFKVIYVFMSPLHTS